MADLLQALQPLFLPAFTAFGARRSLLPSRSTGFTALPMTFAYRALMSFSASVCGFSGRFGSA